MPERPDEGGGSDADDDDRSRDRNAPVPDRPDEGGTRDAPRNTDDPDPDNRGGTDDEVSDDEASGDPVDDEGPKAEPHGEPVSGEAPMNEGMDLRDRATDLKDRAVERAEDALGGNVDLSREDVEVGSGGSVGLTESGEREAATARPEEEFGDVPVYVGGSGAGTTAGRVSGAGVDDTRLEDLLRRGSYEYSEAVDETLGQDTAVGGTGVDWDRRGFDPTPTERSERVGDAAESFLRGGAEILNVPATAAGLKEAGEFVGHGAYETATGGGPEFAGEATAAGAETAGDVYRYATENPAELAGMGAGSLIVSAGAIAGARRISGRAGRGAAWAIQPGEELVGATGYRATKAAAGTRAADRLFPNQEPVLMSEEFAIGATRRGLEKARETAGKVRGDAELPPSPRQRELVERFRPGGPSGELDVEMRPGETEQAAGPSEPLGTQDLAPEPSRDLAGAEARMRDWRERAPDDEPAGDPEPEPDPGWSPDEGMRELIRETGARQRAERQGGDAAMTEGGRATVYSELDYRTGPAAYGRSETEPELEEPGGTLDDVRQDALTQYQDFLTSKAEMEREATRPELDPAPSEAETGRSARRPAKFDTETETERSNAVARTEMLLPFQEPGLPARVSARPDTRAGPGADVGGGFELEPFSDVETETEQGTELETESVYEHEYERELERESEAPAGSETRIETDPLGLRQRRESDDGRDVRGATGDTARGDDELSIGWVGETVAGFAGTLTLGGGGAYRRTTEADLEAQDDRAFGELLPTFTGEESEAFGETADLLFGWSE